MTLREKIWVKIAIFDENLGVGGKKMASGEANVTTSAKIYTSLDSWGPHHCIDIKIMHIWWILEKLERKMWREDDVAKRAKNARAVFIKRCLQQLLRWLKVGKQPEMYDSDM